MKSYVFIGPSLPLAEAQTCIDAVFLPPVAMGDIYKLVAMTAKPGDNIIIIDGFFEQVPAVWHKEILYALENGIIVYGVSSMGALRAAELHEFGMKGYGRIFEAYRSVTIEDDDEVVVAHATEEKNFRSLSHAMISIRFGLDDLLAAGKIHEAEHEILVQRQKGRHYSLRSWFTVLEDAKASNMPQTVIKAIKENYKSFDFKAIDAKNLLTEINSGLECGYSENSFSDFKLNNTTFWLGLMREQNFHIESNNSKIPLSGEQLKLIRYYLATGERREEIIRVALLLNMSAKSMKNWKPDKTDIIGALSRISHVNHLENDKSLQLWKTSNDLADNVAWHKFLLDDAMLHKLGRNFLPNIGSELITALKLTGQYSRVADEFKRKQARKRDLEFQSSTNEELGLDLTDIQKWYEKTNGKMFPDPETYAKDMGFETLRDFVDLLIEKFRDETAV